MYCVCYRCTTLAWGSVCIYTIVLPYYYNVFRRIKQCKLKLRVLIITYLSCSVGGVPDIDSAARSVLRDWNTYVAIICPPPSPPCNLSLSSRGRIKFFTHPPEQSSLPSHVSSDIVRSWSAAFDMSALHEEEKQDLSGTIRGRVVFMLLCGMCCVCVS